MGSPGSGVHPLEDTPTKAATTVSDVTKNLLVISGCSLKPEALVQ
jgi:hypothetical protein